MYGRQQNLLERELPTGIRAMPERKDGWFDLEDWVGPQHPSGRGDVAKIEGILANSGDYSLTRTQGPTGYWGLALDEGIRKYQKRNGLKVDGALRPGGPTIRHMEDAFGALLGGYAPPTPEDIDRHHDVVGDDNPGTIAWQKPPVDLSNIPDLPEIDQEADASNARLARAMLKTGDIDSYAQLMRDAIEQGGKNGLAEVADLTRKIDAASPGLGGKFAGAIADGMTKAQRDAHGIKAQGGQPPGTVQMAMMRRDSALRQSDAPKGKGFGPTGLPGLDAGLAIIPAMKGLVDEFANPGFIPADPQPNSTPGPAPEPVKTPNLPGGSMETPNASDSIETFPMPQEERKKTFVDDVVEVVMPHILEHHSGEFYGEDDKEKREEMRSGRLAALSNNAGAKALKEVIEESGCAELIDHTGGASENGEYKKYLAEKIIHTLTGPRRADLTAELNPRKTGITSQMHINTVTVDALGNPIPREADAGAAIAGTKGVGDERFGMIRKMREDEDPEEYNKEIKSLIREKIKPILNDCRKFLDGFK